MNGTAGSTFGRYVVAGKVGEGSLGVVYRARHQELGRDAAVKVLRPEVRGNAAAVAGMVAEAVTLARLDHPNIVALYDFVQEPERTWLAEQWVEGVPLDAILDAHGRLTPEQALGVVAGALAGLAHAHDSGVVHRDIAASNVLADMAGTSMLVDFGLASPVEGESGLGSAGVVGTPAYLSPEAARSAPVGKPGDVYSAAALTYHLLSGGPVFTGSAWAMVAAHRDRPAPRLEGHGARLADLLERSLAKDPSVRPPDAGAFLAELEEAAAEKYGAAWRTRASIAGLVASTLGVGAGTVAGAAAGGAAPTVVAEGLPQAVTGATKAVVTTGRRVGTKTLIAAGATVAVAIVGVVVGVSVANSDDDEKDDGAEPRSTPTSTEPTLSEEELREQQRQEKTDALEASVPVGVYSWRSAPSAYILRDGSTDPFKGSKGTWKIVSPDCDHRRCSGTMKSSSGSSWKFTWNGTAMTLHTPIAKEPKHACVDSVTGEPRPIQESAVARTYKYDVGPVTITPSADGGPPAGFRFRYEGTVTRRYFGDCEEQPGDFVSWTSSIVATKKG